MRIFNFFVKVTGYLVQKCCFRTKIFYEDKNSQSRRIKGKAIIISNHTSVYDYAVMIFVFFGRVLRYQMAEILFKNKILGWFLSAMGGVKIDRYSHDNLGLDRSAEVLKKGGVLGVFPEGRIPKDGEETPLPFQHGAIYLALKEKADMIPVYTNGSYFNKNRAKVVIGKKIDVNSLYDKELSEKENLEKIADFLRKKVIELKRYIK